MYSEELTFIRVQLMESNYVYTQIPEHSYFPASGESFCNGTNE